MNKLLRRKRASIEYSRWAFASVEAMHQSIGTGVLAIDF
jgi:hypothetical protein